MLGLVPGSGAFSRKDDEHQFFGSQCELPHRSQLKFSADTWSLGILLYELIYEGSPWRYVDVLWQNYRSSWYKNNVLDNIFMQF